MSCDHWWAGFFVDRAEYERLKPDFDNAAGLATFEPRRVAAVDAWRQDPTRYDEPVGSAEAVAEANDFIWAFDLPGFDALAAEFLTTAGAYTSLAERRFFRLAIVTSHTPVSILWRVLGARRAALLPGEMGNVLLHPDWIGSAVVDVRHAFDGVDRTALLDEARRYCGSRVSDSVLEDVIDFLPDGLETARRERLGFVAFARPQI